MPEMDTNALRHYGVIGMKLGVRRASRKLTANARFCRKKNWRDHTR